jgi:glycosyltransferase involved in cell wall biosynthesis
MINKVSCICVTYNRYNNLRVSIHAFLKQTYMNTEMVIIDDSTKLIPKDILELIRGNTHIQYIKTKQKHSIGFKRNKAVCLSTGDYIAIWDDDDIHFHDRITRQMKNIKKKNYDISIISHNVLYYFPITNVFKRISRSDHNNWWYNGITCPSMIFKKKIWDTNKYENINKHEDYLFLKNLPRRTTIHNDTSRHNPYFAYTVHKKGISLIYSYLTSIH